MPWNANLTNLRDFLADHYPTNEDVRRILDQAGIPGRYVRFDAASINTWHSVLTQAMQRNKIAAVIDAARADFPENDLLRLAAEDRLTAVRGPDIDTHVEWRAADEGDHFEKITGKQSTLLPVSFLEAGVQCALSVVRVVRGNGESGSGFLTGDNLLITNHHVLANEDEAATALIQCNYQTSVEGRDKPLEEYRLVPQEGFATSKEDDWTAVRVAGNPVERWGRLALRRVQPKKDDYATIIQHPQGGPKQIALYHNVIAYADDTRVQYLTDTLPGSSGSPVFDHQWNVIAVHHTGGFLREPGTKNTFYRNEGIHIHVVIDGLNAAKLE